MKGDPTSAAVAAERRVRRYVDKRSSSGQGVFTTDASSDITIPHNLGAVPGYVNVFPVAGSRGFFGYVGGSGTTTQFKVRCYTTGNVLRGAGVALTVFWEAKP